MRRKSVNPANVCQSPFLYFLISPSILPRSSSPMLRGLSKRASRSRRDLRLRQSGFGDQFATILGGSILQAIISRQIAERNTSFALGVNPLEELCRQLRVVANASRCSFGNQLSQFRHRLSVRNSWPRIGQRRFDLCPKPAVVGFGFTLANSQPLPS
jgi:hypothetical protein